MDSVSPPSGSTSSHHEPTDINHPRSGEFDIIIVGNGTSGAIMAAEMSRLFPNYEILVVDDCPQRNDNHIPYPADSKDARWTVGVHHTYTQTPVARSWMYQRPASSGGSHFLGHGIIVPPSARCVYLWDVNLSYDDAMDIYRNRVLGSFDTYAWPGQAGSCFLSGAAIKSFCTREDHPWASSKREACVRRGHTASHHTRSFASPANTLLGYDAIENPMWCMPKKTDSAVDGVDPFGISTPRIGVHVGISEFSGGPPSLGYSAAFDDACSIQSETRGKVAYLYNARVDMVTTNHLDIAEWHASMRICAGNTDLHPATRDSLRDMSGAGRKGKQSVTVADEMYRAYREWYMIPNASRSPTVHLTGERCRYEAADDEAATDPAHPANRQTPPQFAAMGIPPPPALRTTGVHVVTSKHPCGTRNFIATLNYLSSKARMVFDAQCNGLLSAKQVDNNDTTWDEPYSGTIRARRAVILCTGSLETPGILAHSGIGSEAEIDTLISNSDYSLYRGMILVDNKNVGQGIVDSPSVVVTAEFGTHVARRSTEPMFSMVTAPESGHGQEFAHRREIADSMLQANDTQHEIVFAMQTCQPQYTLTVKYFNKEVENAHSSLGESVRTGLKWLLDAVASPFVGSRDSTGTGELFNAMEITIAVTAPVSHGSVTANQYTCNYLENKTDLYALLNGYYRVQHIMRVIEGTTGVVVTKRPIIEGIPDSQVEAMTNIMDVKDVLLERIIPAQCLVGGTGIHKSPVKGVVSQTGRVWGVRNLYAVSSAVLSYSGVMYPFGSVCVLAFAMAERIADQIGQ